MHEKPAPYYLIYEAIQKLYNVPPILVRIAKLVRRNDAGADWGAGADVQSAPLNNWICNP